MATDKTPTKAEFKEALSKKGINNLEDLIDAMIPETAGFVYDIDMASYSIPMWRYFGIDVPSLGPAEDTAGLGNVPGI